MSKQVMWFAPDEVAKIVDLPQSLLESWVRASVLPHTLSRLGASLWPEGIVEMIQRVRGLLAEEKSLEQVRAYLRKNKLPPFGG